MTPRKGTKNRLLIRRKDLAKYLQLEDSDLPTGRVTFTIKEVSEMSGRTAKALYYDINTGSLIAVKLQRKP